MGIHITDIEKKIARQIFEKLAEMPIGTRTYTAELASSFGVSEFDDKGPDIWNIDTHLRAVVREDGRFILDDSHHAGRCEGFPYNLDFILLRNNMQQYDKVANDFAIANGHKGAYFYEYWKGYCRYTELENEELDEGENEILVGKDKSVRYATEKEFTSMFEEDPLSENPFPWGKSIYESYKRKEALGVASDYEKEIVAACRDCGYDEPIDEQNMYHALEEAEFLGMKVAIVPDPDFQPGGCREGQCDGWSYHPEVVTQEEYDKLYNFDDQE